MSERESPGRRLLNGWLAIAAHFGEVQTLVILGFTYVLVVGPVAVVTLVARRDFLEKRKLGLAGSAWRGADTRPPSLDNLKQPF